MRKPRVLIERLADLPRLAADAHYRPIVFAQLCGLKLRSLERQCHDCFGMSPKALLTGMWCREAERLLADGNLAKQVKDELGYPYMPDLSRRFKNAGGSTIKEWHKFSMQRM